MAEGGASDFGLGEKLSISVSDEQLRSSAMDSSSSTSTNNKVVDLLRGFLAVQQRRAAAYARLRSGFAQYMRDGGELAYQQLCSHITLEFNNCSKQVIEMESLFLKPEFSREDLAHLLRDVQIQEKEKLSLTATIQVLKKAGRPSERLVSHNDCQFKMSMEHQCMHVHEITMDEGTEEVEADSEYDNALNEAIKGVQVAVTIINEYLDEVRYEIAALEVV